ncbi:hypothetical protein GQX74_010106 [Glossina fuscipes]|nr:hypothetical protein GQX74_010106 [Glossina fuscipes]
MLQILCIIFVISLNLLSEAINANFQPLNKESKIIGGTVIPINIAKYQVSVRLKALEGQYGYGHGHLCGGSVITQRLVLTAAHCVTNSNLDVPVTRSPRELTIVMGSVLLYHRLPNNLQYTVQQVIQHADFNTTTLVNDIALLFLNGYVPWNWPTVKTIPINTKEVLVNTMCCVTGWGRMANGQTSKVLLAGQVPIIKYTECCENYGNLPQSMLCAGYMREGGIDACQGDSGGPLECNGQLVGIVSWGNGCAEPGNPGVYTNVSGFYEWILKINNSLNYTYYSDASNIINNTSIFIAALTTLPITINYLKGNYTISEKDQLRLKMFTELLFLLVFKISSLCTIAIALSANYRIINGATVRWPYARYQASVRWEYLDWTFGWGHQCGGALIASNIVLTAAHCVWNGFYDQPLEPEDILVVLGGLNRYVKDENTLVLGVKDIIVGADFHSKFLTDDIAVLILNNTVSVDFKAAAIIEMNYKPEVISGTKCIVTGWGIMNNKSYPEELQFIEVPIIAKTKCLELYGPKIFKEGMLCAGYIKGDRDACTGDSGGPLVCDNKLVGIVSAGLGCAKPDYPGIYTDVAFYAARVTNALETHRIENDLTKLLNGNLSFNIHVNTSAASLFFFTSKHYFTLLYLLIACTKL